MERLRVVDQAVDEFPFHEVRQKGISSGSVFHTFNASWFGYTLARRVREDAARQSCSGGRTSSIYPARDAALRRTPWSPATAKLAWKASAGRLR